MKRFEYNATTVEQAIHYMRNRAVQLISEQFIWSGKVKLLNKQGEVWGIETYFLKNNKKYLSVYTLVNGRGKGYTKEHLKDRKDKLFITTPPCNVYNFLNRYVSTIQTCNHLLSKEYRIIENLYSSNKAKRSQQYLMNHIDEGIAILNYLGIGNESTIGGFALHPAIQNDNDLFENYSSLSNDNSGIKSSCLMLATEYRSIANSFLSPMESHPGYGNYTEIKLSPLKEVNDMLIADKIQNKKDFDLYHKGKHERSRWLEKYFKRWLQRLEISNDTYNECIKLCTIVKEEDVIIL